MDLIKQASNRSILYPPSKIDPPILYRARNKEMESFPNHAENKHIENVGTVLVGKYASFMEGLTKKLMQTLKPGLVVEKM